MITVDQTGIVESGKSYNTGLTIMTSGSQNAKNFPNWSTGSGLMNFQSFQVISQFFVVVSFVALSRLSVRQPRHKRYLHPPSTSRGSTGREIGCKPVLFIIKLPSLAGVP